MSNTPLWFRRLLVGGITTLTAGGLGLAGLLSTAGAASATSSFTITQIAGTNRFATAVAIAQKAFPSGLPASSTVVIASGLDTNLPDALSASYIAGVMDAPILLTNATTVPSETTTELAALAPKNIIIVGGTGAVSSAEQTTLTTSGVNVTRLAGPTRFATADAVDDYTTTPKVGSKLTAIVADGDNANLVDALGASPLADSGPYPLFLVNGATGTLSTTDLSIMKTDGITNAIIVGGSAAVGSGVGTQLTGAGITPTTEAGSDRSATSEALANDEIMNYGFSTTSFDIASGAQGNLVDSLSGGPFGGNQSPPLPTLITDSATQVGSVAAFATANAATETGANLFGGSAAVNAATESAIQTAGMGTTTTTATTLPQLTGASVVSTDDTLGTTVAYTFSQPVVSATAADFKLYPAAGTPAITGASATVESGGTTVDVVFSALTTASDLDAYTLATVASSAVSTSTGTTNPDGSFGITPPSTTTSTADFPTLTSVGNFRAGTATPPDTLVDFTFGSAPGGVAAGATDGPKFTLVSSTGTETAGVSVTAVSGDVVTVAFSGTISASTDARGYVAEDTVTGTPSTAVNPLEAAAVTGGATATSNADLVSATLMPSTNQVLYVFDKPVTTPVPTDFSVYTASGGAGTLGSSATVGSGTTADDVLVTFTGDTFAGVIGANVKTGTAVGANYNADSVSVTGVASTITAGVIDAPQLSGVALSMGTLAEQATYTFTQPLNGTAPTPAKFHLYEANGTEFTATACADGTGTSVTTVVCTLYGMGSGATGTPAAPATTSVLGTVDAGAVTGSTMPDNNANPEGAANATS